MPDTRELTTKWNKPFETSDIYKRRFCQKLLDMTRQELKFFEKNLDDTNQRSRGRHRFLKMIEESLAERIVNKTYDDIKPRFDFDIPLLKAMREFGLTPRESEMFAYYIQTAKPVTVPDYLKQVGLKVRTEAYHTCATLIKMGLLEEEPYFDSKSGNVGIRRKQFVTDPINALQRLFDGIMESKTKSFKTLVSEINRIQSNG